MTKANLQPSTRLYAILAREAPVAVIFRRGPSKEVLLSLWRTDNDEFLDGQWFKGRIYERRCDLSPDGKRLIYFAADFKEPYYSWTAISKPPYLTALVLWPKGDCWGGGGLFANNHKIQLNHRDTEMDLADGFRLPAFVKVKTFGERPGWGEDSPIVDSRLTRDGWKMEQAGEWHPYKTHTKEPINFKCDPPQIWAKANLAERNRELKEITKGFFERDGPAHVNEYVVRYESGETFSLGRAEWADWDHNGDLLFAKEGKMFRLHSNGSTWKSLDEAQLVRDFTGFTFEAREPPMEATMWE